MTALPQHVYASPLELAVARYNRADHIPKRTCLGCGGGTYRLADGRQVWVDCEARGVRIYELVEHGPLDVREERSVRFTWAQVAAAAPSSDQVLLGL